MAKHREVHMLLQIGEYQAGTNALADEAIAKADAIKAFLSQRTNDYAAPNETESAALGAQRIRCMTAASRSMQERRIVSPATRTISQPQNGPPMPFMQSSSGGDRRSCKSA